MAFNMANPPAYLDFVTTVIQVGESRFSRSIELSDFAPSIEKVRNSEAMYFRVDLVHRTLARTI
jgi:hypothetical protein